MFGDVPKREDFEGLIQGGDPIKFLEVESNILSNLAISLEKDGFEPVARDARMVLEAARGILEDHEKGVERTSDAWRVAAEGFRVIRDVENLFGVAP